MYECTCLCMTLYVSAIVWAFMATYPLWLSGSIETSTHSDQRTHDCIKWHKIYTSKVWRRLDGTEN